MFSNCVLAEVTVNRLAELTSTEAVIEPVAVLDRFNPTIPDAGTLVNPEPLPLNDPVYDPEEPVLVNILAQLASNEGLAGLLQTYSSLVSC
jgi:hypothetical protein